TDASVLVGLDEAAGEDGERRFLGADALDAEQHVTECVTIDCELHRLAFSDMFHGQRTDHLSSLMVHLQKRQLLLLLVYGSESKDSAHSSNRGCGFVYKSRKCLISGWLSGPGEVYDPVLRSVDELGVVRCGTLSPGCTQCLPPVY